MSKIQWTEQTWLIEITSGLDKAFNKFFFWLYVFKCQPLKNVSVFFRGITGTASRNHICSFGYSAFSYGKKMVKGCGGLVAVSAKTFKDRGQHFFANHRDCVNVSTPLACVLLTAKTILSVSFISLPLICSAMCRAFAFFNVGYVVPHLTVGTPTNTLFSFLSKFYFRNRFNSYIGAGFTFCFETIKTGFVFIKIRLLFPKSAFGAMLQTALCKSQIFFNRNTKFFSGAFHRTFFGLCHNYKNYNTLGV